MSESNDQPVKSNSNARYMPGPEMRRAKISPEMMSEALVQDIPSSSVKVATLQLDTDARERVHPSQKISTEEQDQMLREAAAMGSVTAAEDKYGVHRGYLRAAMRRRFGSLEAMKSVLLGLVTENAIAVQMVAAEKIEELSAPQAVFAGKMLVDTMEKIEKSIQSAPRTVNFAQLEKVGDAIKTLRGIVDGSGSDFTRK